MKINKYSIIALVAIVFYISLGVAAIAQETPADGETDIAEEAMTMDTEEESTDETIEEEDMTENEETVTGTFSDVDGTNEYFDAITYVAGQGIVEGYEDGTYKPDQNINRAEFTKILAGAAYGYDPNQDPSGYDIYSLVGLSFSDLVDQEWYVPYLRKAFLQGVIEGYPDGTFKPEQNVNFAEAAKIIVTSFGYETQLDVDLWYKPYVDVLADMRGIPVSIKSFDQAITRGEMAEMIYRIKAIVRDKNTATYETIHNFELAAAGQTAVGEGISATIEGYEEQKVSLYFGNAAENAAARSYPVYYLDCFELGCEAAPMYEDEWTLNTKDRFSFDMERNDIYYSKLLDYVYQVYKLDLDTQESTSVGFDERHDMSYRSYIYQDTMAVVVSDSGKITVVKYDLTTGIESSIPVFDAYKECNWPAIGADGKVFATCTQLGTSYEIVDEEGTVYYSSGNHLESLIVSAEGIAYFVEDGFLKVLDLASHFVRGTDVIPPYHIVYTLTISPDGNYLAGFGEINGEWVVGIYDRRTGILTMPIQLRDEPGNPSFGPYYDWIDRTLEKEPATSAQQI